MQVICLCGEHLCGQTDHVLFAGFLLLGRRQHVVLGMSLVGVSQVGLRTVVMATSTEHIPNTREDHDTDSDDRRIVKVLRSDRLDGGEGEDDTFEYWAIGGARSATLPGL